MQSNIGSGMTATTGSKPAKAGPVLIGRCPCGGTVRVNGRGLFCCSKCGKAIEATNV